MKKLLISFAITGMLFNLTAQTTVSGNQSGTWTATNSPYQVTGELTVPTGQTLTVEAGVVINFQGHYKFNVDGKVLATGTETDRITFTTDNQAVGWGGVRLDGTNDISIFTHCIFEYGKTSTGNYPDIHGGAILLLNANAEFYNCIFSHNDATGDNNGIGGAVYAFNTGSSTATLTKFIDCQFLENHAYGEGGAMRLTNDGNTEITRCQFLFNNAGYGGGAIHIFSALDTTLTNCLFYQNSSNNSGGGAIKTMNPSVTLEITNCTFVSNSALGAGEGGALDLSYTDVNIINSIIYENTQTYGDEINIGMGSSAEINYSDLEMPSAATGTNNINADPLFEDPWVADFHLQGTSPCIDAGTDVGLPFEGNAPDMGCFEYDSLIGLGDIQSEFFILFPNPTNGIFSFETEIAIKSITLTDLLGKIVFSKNTSLEILDISHLENGTYFAQIVTKNNFIFTDKIILSH